MRSTEVTPHHRPVPEQSAAARTEPASTGARDLAGDLVGKSVGRYQVFSLLGVGGMGEVYVGDDPHLDRPVAIKRLHPASVAREERVERLRLEARIHGRLSHPNIVRVYDFVHQDGADHIISEYVDGQSLWRLTRTSPPTYERGLEITLGVVRGLALAHRSGVVHRDLKTENVLIGSDGAVKITDFGLSRSILPEDDPLRTLRRTVQGQLIGTFQSMSPEQSFGDEVDHRSDLFSLGILIFEVLHGSSPFDGRSIEETLENIRNLRQRPLREVVPRVPVALSELVDRLLAKRREARPASVDELEALLVSYTAGGPTPSQRFRAVLERRQVAMLHLSAVTELATDLETLASALEVWDSAVRRAAERLDATLLYVVGGEALLCFGYPRSHENNTERAAHLVAELSRTMQDATATRLELSAGLDVGEVFVRSTEHGPLLVGGVVQEASRVGRLAAPGQALCSTRAQALLTRFYRLQPLQIRAASAVGSDPALSLCYEIVEPIDMVRHAGQPELTRLVGRDLELHALRRAWDTTLEEWDDLGFGTGKVIVIEGEAGLGKSRLVRGFLHDLSERQGRRLLTYATASGRYTAFEPFRRLLRQLPEMRNEGAPPRREDIARCAAQLHADTDEIIAAVAHVCDVATEHDHEVASALSRREGADAIAMKLAWFLLGLAEQHPLLVVIEDLHWADHSSRVVVRELVRRARSLAICVVTTYRPELQPEWVGEAIVTRMSLRRLTSEQSAEIIDACLPSDVLRPSVRDAILAKAEGVPLWLEEISRAVAEQPDLEKANLPTSLRDSVQSRLQLLGESTRRTAELAAAIGRDVSPALLFAVLGRPRADVAAELAALEGAGLIQQFGFRSRRFVFRHVLMREAVYGGIDGDARRAAHRQIVETLERDFGDWRNERPELFAHHYEASRQDVEAVTCWELAGARAARMWAHDLACRHFRRALELLEGLPLDQARLARERAIRELLGPSLSVTDGLGAGSIDKNSARLSVLVAESDEPPRWSDLWQQWAFGFVVCDVGKMSGALGQLEALVEAGAAGAETPFVQYLVSTARGVGFLHFARLPQARAALVDALAQRCALLEVLRAFADQSVVTVPGAYLAWVELMAGHDQEAWERQRAEEAAHDAGSAAHLNALAFGTTLGIAARDYRETLSRADRVLADGPGRLVPGHVHFAGMARDIARVQLSLEGANPSLAHTTVPAAQARTQASLETMWAEFLGWHAGVMRAGSMVSCASMVETCVDVARHPSTGGALRDAAIAQGESILGWAHESLASAGVEDLHRYFSAEVHRVEGRLARLLGDGPRAERAFDQARVCCAQVEVEGEGNEGLLRRRLAESLAES